MPCHVDAALGAQQARRRPAWRRLSHWAGIGMHAHSPRSSTMGKERTSLEQDSKFARALGSSDFHTREAGLRALTTWLSRKHDIEELELLKLWKGVFYCFWHSDKAAVQVRRAVWRSKPKPCRS